MTISIGKEYLIEIYISLIMIHNTCIIRYGAYHMTHIVWPSKYHLKPVSYPISVIMKQNTIIYRSCITVVMNFQRMGKEVLQRLIKTIRILSVTEPHLLLEMSILLTCCIIIMKIKQTYQLVYVMRSKYRDLRLNLREMVVIQLFALLLMEGMVFSAITYDA